MALLQGLDDIVRTTHPRPPAVHSAHCPILNIHIYISPIFVFVDRLRSRAAGWLRAPIRGQDRAQS